MSQLKYEKSRMKIQFLIVLLKWERSQIHKNEFS